MTDDKNKSTREDDIIRRAKLRFARAVDYEAENRQAAVDDLRFKAGEQWDEGIKAQRESKRRPCLTINKMLTFTHQVVNEGRQNRPAIHISPLGEDDKKGAQFRQGLINEIERASDADIAYDTAFDSAVSNGFGYWRIISEYESPDSFNQVIRIKRIRNPMTVYLDCEHQQPDGSDSMWGFVTDLVTRDEFKEDWPKANVLNWDLQGVGEPDRQWIQGDMIRIAEYFEIQTEKRTLMALANGVVGYQDDFDESVKAHIKANPAYVLDTREADCKTVMWYKMTACDILEEQELPGQYIPIIEVVGDEIDIEGKVRKSGIIRFAKGPQQMYNYAATNNIETVALQPKAPYIMAEGQDEGYEEMWNSANSESYSRLIYKPTTIGNQLAPPPARQQPPSPPAGWMEMQQSAAQDMMATTGVRFDSTLQERTADESGIALSRLQAHQQLGSFHYSDNLSRSLKHSGRIILDWIPVIYDTERDATTLGEDGKQQHVKIDPQAAQSHQIVQTPQGGQNVYNPKLGKFEVAVTIGPNFATKREESSRGMMEMLKIAGQKGELILDLVAKEQDWQYSDEISKRFAMTLPPGMLEVDESELSPQVQAAMGQLQQQTQQLQQQNQQLIQALNDKTTDQKQNQDKIDKDFEAKLLAIQEKGQANLLTHLRQIVTEVQATERTRLSGEGALHG